MIKEIKEIVEKEVLLEYKVLKEIRVIGVNRVRKAIREILEIYLLLRQNN